LRMGRRFVDVQTWSYHKVCLVPGHASLQCCCAFTNWSQWLSRAWPTECLGKRSVPGPVRWICTSKLRVFTNATSPSAGTIDAALSAGICSATKPTSSAGICSTSSWAVSGSTAPTDAVVSRQCHVSRRLRGENKAMRLPLRLVHANRRLYLWMGCGFKEMQSWSYH